MIWFTSDQHFSHQNILKYCPNRNYKTVEEMNETIVQNWNNFVKSEDTVYCLGDFSMAIKPVQIFTSRLNGHKILIHGNHDWTHPSHKKSKGEGKQQKLIEEYKNYGWVEIHDELIIELAGIGKVKLCHLPYEGFKNHSADDKYASYRPSDNGIPLLCGHVHQAWKTAKSSKETSMLNVGVDVHDMCPIKEDEVLKYLRTIK